MYYRSSKSRFFFFAWPFLPGDLTWPWPLLWPQSTVNDTYKCQRHYPCRLVGFVCAEHRNFARRCHQARNVEYFHFDLTCDVTRDPEVNKICFRSTVFPGLSNAAWIFRIGPVVSEIRGGARNSPPPPPVGRVIKIPQWGAGYRAKIARFWENLTFLTPCDPKFDLIKNDRSIFCRTCRGLSKAVYHLSLSFLVFEFSGGGGDHLPPPPPAVRRWLRPPAVRGLMLGL